jgi:glutamate--cysteine ligase catalytic subunit
VVQRGTLVSALSVASIILTHNRSGKTAPVFHPEFGRFMLETTPGKPWGIDLKDLLDVEPDMKWR